MFRYVQLALQRTPHVHRRNVLFLLMQSAPNNAWNIIISNKTTAVRFSRFSFCSFSVRFSESAVPSGAIINASQHHHRHRHHWTPSSSIKEGASHVFWLPNPPHRNTSRERKKKNATLAALYMLCDEIRETTHNNARYDNRDDDNDYWDLILARLVRLHRLLLRGPTANSILWHTKEEDFIFRRRSGWLLWPPLYTLYKYESAFFSTSIGQYNMAKDFFLCRHYPRMGRKKLQPRERRLVRTRQRQWRRLRRRLWGRPRMA